MRDSNICSINKEKTPSRSIDTLYHKRSNNKPMDNFKKNMNDNLPLRPGAGGNASVFICPICGQKFVRTMPGQNRCSACLDKDK